MVRERLLAAERPIAHHEASGASERPPNALQERHDLGRPRAHLAFAPEWRPGTALQARQDSGLGQANHRALRRRRSWRPLLTAFVRR
jgi:hypothetical protein